MRAVVQRVRSATVAIGGEVRSAIGPGLLVLLGVGHGDTAEDIEWLAGKIVRMRLFADGAGIMNRSLLEVGGEVMVVSQFTLHASTKKGNRPSYCAAAPPAEAAARYREFVGRIAELVPGRPVATGEFGAMMDVALVNDGPVTIIIDSRGRE